MINLQYESHHVDDSTIEMLFSGTLRFFTKIF